MLNYSLGPEGRRFKSYRPDLMQVTSADADGNLITQTDIATGNTINYTWDYRNRLTEVIYKDSGGSHDGNDTIRLQRPEPADFADGDQCVR